MSINIKYMPYCTDIFIEDNITCDTQDYIAATCAQLSLMKK